MWKWNLSSLFLWLVMVSVTIWRFISALRFKGMIIWDRLWVQLTLKNNLSLKTVKVKLHVCERTGGGDGAITHSFIGWISSLNKVRKRPSWQGRTSTILTAVKPLTALFLCSHSVCEDCLMSWWSRRRTPERLLLRKAFQSNGHL